MLGSLPKKFDMKVIAIEESHYISTMTVDELVGSLKTFESVINERSEKKMSITFTPSVEDSEDSGELNSEGVSEDLVLLGRQFNKVMRKSRSNVQNKSFDISKNQDSNRRGKTEEKHIQGK